MGRLPAALRSALRAALRSAVLPAAALALAACAATPRVPAQGREQVIESLSRQARFLAVAAYLSPFYADGSRLLLSVRSPAETPVTQEPGGPTLPAPTPRRVLLPGTPVWVESVQFPTAGVLLGRPSGTPRDDPWLVTQVSGEQRPAILLLSPNLTRAEDLIAQAGRVLTPDDPTQLFLRLPASHRDAIGRKEVVEGMGATAVTMSWGHPDRIVQDRTTGQEEWTWRGGGGGSDRKATFQDERLVRFTRSTTTPAR